LPGGWPFFSPSAGGAACATTIEPLCGSAEADGHAPSVNNAVLANSNEVTFQRSRRAMNRYPFSLRTIQWLECVFDKGRTD
jgi:hypothetical protein